LKSSGGVVLAFSSRDLEVPRQAFTAASGCKKQLFTVRTVKNSRPKTVVLGYLDYTKRTANTSACFSDVSAFWPPQVMVVLLLRVMPLIFQCLHLSMCTRPRGRSMQSPSNLAGIEPRKEDTKWRSKHSAAGDT
jgi:hypothetical protein